MNVLTPCFWFFSPGTKRAVTLTGQATVVVVAKRDADDKSTYDDCVIYRYGSFCTAIEVFGEITFNLCHVHRLETWDDCQWLLFLLVFVFRGHWESRDSPNGQCCGGNTWKGQKRFRYHCYLPGKVNDCHYNPKLCFLENHGIHLMHWMVFFLQSTKGGVQCDSGCRVHEANSHGL